MATTKCSRANVPVMRGDAADGTVYVTKPACGLWSCPGCAERKRREWAMRVYHGVATYQAEGLGNWVFVTQTAHSKRRETWMGVHDFRAEWPRLRALRHKAIGRPGEIKYARVLELHKDGAVHAHLITRPAMGEKWWRDQGATHGLGYIAQEVELREPELAAWYVAKYLSKSLGSEWPKGVRRISVSQGWPPLPDGEDHQTIDADWRPMFTVMNSEQTRQYIEATENRDVVVLGSGW